MAKLIAEEYWQDINVYSVNTEKRSAADFPYDVASDKQKAVCLNGTWKFKYLDTVNKIPQFEGFINNDYDVTSFDDLPVPSEWQIVGVQTGKDYGKPCYTNIKYPYAISYSKIPYVKPELNPCGLYVKEFDIESLEDNVFIHFGGINSNGEVYVNGEFVGYSQDTFDETEYDITKFVKVGKNRLAVIVRQFCDGSYLEDQDMWRLSGIFRDVNLVFKPKAYIKDYFIRSKNFSADYKKAKFLADVEVEARGTDLKNASVEIKVLDKVGKVFVSEIKKIDDVLDTKSAVAQFAIDVENMELWSHENPYLYTVEVRIVVDGKAITLNKHKYGFREVKIVGLNKETGRGPFILLNGVPLKICGVNRHDFHPDYGHAVPANIIKSDLMLLKEHNVTNIRTCHYPNARKFYDLCDEVGILVMSENNLETHGLSKKIPHNNPLWSKQCCYRMSNMVNSYKNNSCILFWSLGNESGVGTAFADMRKTALAIDDTRPIHYEPDNKLENSDILSEMYTQQQSMKAIGENKPIVHSRAVWNNMMGYRLKPEDYVDRPYIECEYSHAMGNSMGNFADYWNDFKKYDRLAGGYIWDFADQTIHTKTKDGKDVWNYGGDFGDKPNDGNFAFNGIVQGDRKPNPHLFEVVKCYQQADFKLEGNVVKVLNRFMFTSLAKFSLRMVYKEEGKIIDENVVKLNECKYMETEEVKVPFDLKTTNERTLDCFLILDENIMNLKKGHVMAREQFVLGEYDFDNEIDAKGKISCDYDKASKSYIVRGDGFEVIVSKKSGEITSYKRYDKEYLVSGIKPNFARANIDNERLPQVPVPLVQAIMGMTVWHSTNKHLKPLSFKVDIDDDKVEFEISWFAMFTLGTKSKYTIYPNGEIELKLKCMNCTVWDMPRYGFTMELTNKVDEPISFYGKGPHENYCDRKTGAYLDVYEFDEVEEYIHDYLYPQENGNRCDMRWMKVGDVTVQAVDKAFEGSVHPYTMKMLQEAQHKHELGRKETVTLNIDGRQQGVGGDVPALASLKKPYKILPYAKNKLKVNIKFGR